MELNELERSKIILDLHERRKVQQVLDALTPFLKMVQQDSLDFDNIQLAWNADGTLSTLEKYKDRELQYILHFVWNADGSLDSIRRT